MRAALVTLWIMLLCLVSFTAVNHMMYLIDTPASDASFDAETFAPLALCWGAWYITPWVVALIREHHQTLAIFVLNIFLGWTLLGWVAALVWACTAVHRLEEVGRARRYRTHRRRGGRGAL